MSPEFERYLATIDQPDHQLRVRSVLTGVQAAFPALHQRVAWHQPMFTDHGTFVIGFSVSQHHLAVALEGPTMVHFRDRLVAAGYHPGKRLARIGWDQSVDRALLAEIIQFVVSAKADVSSFWWA